MPYQIGKHKSCKPGQTAVIESDTGNVAPGGCHDTEQEAKDHMAALYANVEDARAEAGGHSGIMSAFFVAPDRARELVIDHENALGPDELHVTLIYFGRLDEIGEDIDRDDLIKVMRDYAAGHGPVTAEATGIGRFFQDNDGTNAVVINLENDDLLAFRQGLLDTLFDSDILPKSRHAFFTPHITLTYVRADEPTPLIGTPKEPFTFNALHLVYGDERHSFPLDRQMGGRVEPTKTHSLGNTTSLEIFIPGNTGIVIPPEEVDMPDKGPFYLRAFPMVGDEVRAEDLLADTSLPVPFVASTEGVKRDGKNLRAGDWVLNRYDKYGPVLFGHDYNGAKALPIGLGRALVDGHALKIDVTYDVDDPFAMRVRSKAIRGMMAGSVGWDRRNGKNELIEFSNVNVPIDPDALPAIQRAGLRAMRLEIDEALGDGEDEWSTLVEQLRDMVLKKIDDDIQAFLTKYERGGEEPGGEPEEEPEEPGEEPGERGAHEEKEDKHGKEGAEQRAGAVLSKKNRTDLAAALELIQAVIARAEPEEAEEELPVRGQENEADEEEPELNEEMLHSIRSSLEGVPT
jgi:2'-5' RNA ligase